MSKRGGISLQKGRSTGGDEQTAISGSDTVLRPICCCTQRTENTFCFLIPHSFFFRLALLFLFPPSLTLLVVASLFLLLHIAVGSFFFSSLLLSVLAPRLPRHLSFAGTLFGWSTKACNLLVGVLCTTSSFFCASLAQRRRSGLMASQAKVS